MPSLETPPNGNAPGVLTPLKLGGVEGVDLMRQDLSAAASDLLIRRRRQGGEDLQKIPSLETPANGKAPVPPTPLKLGRGGRRPDA